MTVYICGDSTAASYPPARAPLMGWGQCLQEFLPPETTVVNAAMAGRSSKSFISEGRLLGIESALSPGDIMLIQFGHNDASDLVWRHTDPDTSFYGNLSIFVDTARNFGAAPVLLTPICRRVFENGALMPSHGAYLAAVYRLAAQMNVPLIDLYAQSFSAVSRLGDAGSRDLFIHVPPGLYPSYPDGAADDTHTCAAGARLFAGMAAEALKRIVEEMG